MNGWKKAGRGQKVRLVASFEAQEAAVLRGLVGEVRQMLAGRTDDNPADELAVLTGIRTGPSTRPDDRVLARLLPDFTTEDADLAAGLRSLHEPAQHRRLLRLERRHQPHLLPAPGLLPAVHELFCMVAHRPAACSLATSASILSLSPAETAALPFWCTSSISAVAFGSG